MFESLVVVIEMCKYLVNLVIVIAEINLYGSCLTIFILVSFLIFWFGVNGIEMCESLVIVIEMCEYLISLVIVAAEINFYSRHSTIFILVSPLFFWFGVSGNEMCKSLIIVIR